MRKLQKQARENKQLLSLVVMTSQKHDVSSSLEKMKVQQEEIVTNVVSWWRNKFYHLTFGV